MRIAAAAGMVGLLVASVVLAAASGGGPSPKVTLVHNRVHGTHFAARERVTVRLASAGVRTVRQARASASGSFATQVPSRDACLGPLVVMARGATGDRAHLKLPQRACPPALEGSG
jgi:hypothetical protein